MHIFKAVFDFQSVLAHQEDLDIYVAFKDGSSAILYAVHWLEGDLAAGAKWISRSDGSNEKYGSIMVDDVTWATVVTALQTQAIRDRWEENASEPETASPPSKKPRGS